MGGVWVKADGLWDRVGCWRGAEKRARRSEEVMGGLLFLACPAICPGVKMCTHTYCPWAGVATADWQRVAASESDFLHKGGSRPSLGLPSTPSLPPPPLPCSSTTLPHLSLSGMPARGRWGQAGPVEKRKDVCPAPRVFLKSLRERSSSHWNLCLSRSIWFVSRPLFLRKLPF